MRRPTPEDPAAARQEAILAHEITRRNALRFGALGMGGVGITALLAACGTSNGGGGSAQNTGGSAPTGSAYSDDLTARTRMRSFRHRSRSAEPFLFSRL